MTPARFFVPLLCVLLASCSTTRYGAAPAAEELTRYVLILEESPGGQLTHAWRHAEEFDLSRYKYRSSAHSPTYGRIVLVSGRQRDCDEENRQCMRMCMQRPLPRGFGHLKSGGRGMGGKEVWCNEQCMPPYRDCQELQGLRPQEFAAVDEAVEWLKRNHQTILVGSAVLIAGVGFVTVSAGAGLIVLAPAVLLAT